MNVTNPGRIDKEEAAALFRQLGAAVDQGDDDGYDLDPKVESWNNKHYTVVFSLKGRSVALYPDEARDFAEALLIAADEADAKMSGKPGDVP